MRLNMIRRGRPEKRTPRKPHNKTNGAAHQSKQLDGSTDAAIKAIARQIKFAARVIYWTGVHRSLALGRWTAEYEVAQ